MEIFRVEMFRVVMFSMEMFRVELFRVGMFRVGMFRVEMFRAGMFRVEMFSGRMFSMEMFRVGMQFKISLEKGVYSIRLFYSDRKLIPNYWCSHRESTFINIEFRLRNEKLYMYNTAKARWSLLIFSRLSGEH